MEKAMQNSLCFGLLKECFTSLISTLQVELIVDFDRSIFEGEEMRKRIVLAILLSLLIMLTLPFGIRNALAQKDKIVIGVAESYTGVNAAGCQMHHLYYTMIIDDYNAKGGLYVPELGKRLPIELLHYDDASDIATCLTLIEKLITVDNVDLMFAPWSTEFNSDADPLFEQYKMPVVGLTVGSDALAADMKSGEITYSFVTLGQPYESAEQVKEVLMYANSTLGGDTPVGPWSDTRIRTVGIIYRSDLHGTEHSKAIADALTAAGFQVTKTAVPVDIADFTPQVTALKSASVDVAMYCGYGEGFLFVKACEAQEYNPKMLFHGPVLETPLMMYAVFQFTPGEIAGLTYYDGFPSTNYTTPTLAAWALRHKQLQGFLPFPAAGPAFYTGVECLFKAVELVGLNHTAIRDALATVTWNDTLMGKAKLRIGQSILVDNTGTTAQWTGKEMMDVIWPRNVTVTKIIYPKYPWSWATVPDVNRDGKVDILDISTAAKAFGTSRGDARYTFEADVNQDGKVNIMDIAQIAKNWAKKAFS
jgi:branched-chain amino acid transport system substrate-binding protein